jgi:molybdenum cofactor cytidylyltransferase
MASEDAPNLPVDESQARLGAVVLAAGSSRRMGQPKLVMPWGKHTVIGQVVTVLAEAAVEPIVVVTGGSRVDVEAALRGYPVRTVYNPDHQQAEMLTSLQVGLRALPAETDAVFIALGDQPMVEAEIVHAIKAAYQAGSRRLLIPSYQMRRGHPWLVDKSLWADLLAMPRDQTMRDFLKRHESDLEYVVVDSACILKDIDTPEDYDNQRPRRSGP